MAKPSTRQGLIDYCFRKLGAPVLEINVDDDQVDDLVDDTIQYYNERHYNGIERMFLKYKITQEDIDRGTGKGTDGVGIVTTTGTQDVSGYGTVTSNFYETSNFISVPDHVIGINKIFKFDSSSISGGMFSIKYQLFLNDLYYFNSVNLLQYAMTKTYLEDIDHLLTTEKQIRFNQRQDRLYLDIDWGAQQVGDFIVIDCFRALDPDTFTQVYNDPFVKLYLTALIKRQWGQNLIKFRGTKLPGGIELNGREIYDDAVRDLDSIKQRMQEYETPPLDFIGWCTMARNSYFLQGSQSEQRLIQDLINEQLKIYGLDITYIPRKFVNTQSIIEEVQSSKFDDNFVLEAYVNSYDGYSGAGDVLTKFGMSLRDEVELTISKERFEDFISPFMSASDNIDLASRPREGDLVFFPLGQRLFEVKFVEHEEPFYQLGKNYVYKLKCELFEYENEVIDTSIDAIDTQVQEEGYISTLQLVGVGRTATATVSLGTGYIREIFLNNDGSGFTGTPVVSISTSPSGLAGDNATAVAFTTERAGVRSIEKVLMTNAGANYTSPPIITFSGGGGTGAAATCSIETSSQGVIRFTVTDNGVGFGTAPTVTVSNPAGGTAADKAVGIASMGVDNGGFNEVKSIFVQNAGKGYTLQPTITISDPETISGIGTYQFNEVVQGMRSGTQARVKNWDFDTGVLSISNVSIGGTITGFFAGEDVKGLSSGALYSVSSFNEDNTTDKYNEGDIFETEADAIVDFTESNPFGTF